MPPSHYALNVHRLKGLFQLKQRTLQAMNLPTLVVSQQQWHQMPDHEQLPFLEREIRSLL
jgi:RAP domain